MQAGIVSIAKRGCPRKRVNSRVVCDASRLRRDLFGMKHTQFITATANIHGMS
jgi:hypothetical protein